MIGHTRSQQGRGKGEVIEFCLSQGVNGDMISFPLSFIVYGGWMMDMMANNNTNMGQLHTT